MTEFWKKQKWMDTTSERAMGILEDIITKNSKATNEVMNTR